MIFTFNITFSSKAKNTINTFELAVPILKTLNNLPLELIYKIILKQYFKYNLLLPSFYQITNQLSSIITVSRQASFIDVEDNMLTVNHLREFN